MKKLSRLLAVLLVVLLLASLGSSAFAANVTINLKDKETHTFAAYQIFKGDVEDGKLVRTVWGNGVNSTTLVSALTNHFEEDTRIAKVVEGKTEAELQAMTASNVYGNGFAYKTNTTIKDLFAALTTIGAPNVTAVQLEQAFFDGWGQQEADSAEGKALASFLGTHPAVLDQVAGSGTGAETTAVIQDLEPGYYFIKETGELNNKNAAYSRFILRVVSENITIDAKASIPSVEKKVKEEDYKSNNDLSSIGRDATDKGVDVGAGFNDVADYNIGDKIEFEFFGTVAENYADYAAYYYKFSDAMDESLTFDGASSVKVYYTNDKVAEGGSVSWTPIPLSDNNYTVNTTDAQHFTVEFPITGGHKGLKDIPGITKDSVIKVTYTATLNDKAVIGLPGQENKVDLTFSNNPNGEGTGKTPEDEVIVFTYQLNGTKYKDFKSASNLLPGANFVLTKVENSETKYFTGNDAARWKTVTGAPAAGATKAEIVAFYTNQGISVFTSTDAGVICEVKGLDYGVYTLVEIAAPDGYTAASPTKVTITSIKNMGQNWTGTPGDALTKFEYAINTDDNITAPDSIARADIINMQGTVLPTTGGMGTTLFYVCGAMLVLAAAVLLIARRRMDAE